MFRVHVAVTIEHTVAFRFTQFVIAQQFLKSLELLETYISHVVTVAGGVHAITVTLRVSVAFGVVTLVPVSKSSRPLN